jgi:hypothetical protein
VSGLAGKLQLWRRDIWRAEVKARLGELTNRLRAAEAAAGDLDASQRADREIVETSCNTASAAATMEQGVWGGLVSWWTGDLIATAWEAVHEAEVALVRLESDEAVRANLPWLIYWIQSAMEKDERKTRLLEELEKQEKGGAVDRTRIEQAYRGVIVVNSDRYANLHTFRNNLAVTTALLACLVIVIALWHGANTGFVTLCGSTDGKAHCLDGSTSHAWDVAMVALVGAVGGLLAIAFGLAKIETPPSRYDPRAWQAVLKPVAGAATALAGLLLLQADLLISPAGDRSESLYLAYALLFGFSQQLFTQFVDKRAHTLIEADGEEAKEAKKKK